MYIRSALIVLALAVSMPALAQTAGNTPNTGPQGTGNFVSGRPADTGNPIAGMPGGMSHKSKSKKHKHQH
jgi:hypothetical protein